MKTCKSGNAEVPERLELLDYIEMQDELIVMEMQDKLIFMEYERQLENSKERENHER